MVFILIYFFFCSQLRSIKNKEDRKNKRKSNDKIIEQLLKSLIDGEVVENEELNLISDILKNCEDPIPVVKEFDKIIKCKKKIILNLAYK